MDERLKILSREFFPAGAVIIRQGEPGTRAFIIESGEIEIWTTVDDKRRQLGVVTTGGIFGEMALIDNQPRMASATALTGTTCVIINDVVFDKKMAAADPFIAGLLRIFVRNIRSLTQHSHMNEPAVNKADAA
jgi:CRP/FNR family cyclic AMP-dependent transcriptional regulator